MDLALARESSGMLASIPALRSTALDAGTGRLPMTKVLLL